MSFQVLDYIRYMMIRFIQIMDGINDRYIVRGVESFNQSSGHAA